MTLGKKERMIAVIVVIAGLAAAIHFLVFQEKAKTYDQTSKEYKAGIEQLSSAEDINDPAKFEQYKAKTGEYGDLVTSVVAELNLQKVDIPTSPPVSSVDIWGSGTLALLNQLNAQRNGGVKLTFLDQTGWNLTPTLPDTGAVGPLADRVATLYNIYGQLRFAPPTIAQVPMRANYNSALNAIGLAPTETSFFYMPQQRLFLNDLGLLENLLKGPNGMASTSGGYAPYYNPYGLQRFGQAIPALKKMWVYNLVVQQLQQENALATMPAGSLQRFAEALEIGIPLGEDEPLNSINKQLSSLLDIIGIATRTGVQEITSVKFLRPINVAKASLFEPGATPVPTVAAPTPNMGGGGMMGGMMDPAMMGDPALMGGGIYGGGGTALEAAVTPVPDAERVGTGAGIELDMRGDNASLTRFYYELSHLTRTYGIDDVYFVNDGQAALRTTATIEVITDVNLQAAGGASQQ